jgi:hypothetical protein
MVIFFFDDLFIVCLECVIALPECKGIHLIDIIRMSSFE